MDPRMSARTERARRVVEGPAERLNALLADFVARMDGVRGIAVSDRSGLPVAASFTTNANILTVTAMSTMVVQSSQRVYRNLGLDGPNDIVMVGPDSTVFVASAAQNQLSIIVVLEGFANLGLVRIEVERLARDLTEILAI